MSGEELNMNELTLRKHGFKLKVMCVQIRHKLYT